MTKWAFAILFADGLGLIQKRMFQKLAKSAFYVLCHEIEQRPTPK
jgi:hypothetical protein